jgi:hypothetical protein
MRRARYLVSKGVAKDKSRLGMEDAADSGLTCTQKNMKN